MLDCYKITDLPVEILYRIGYYLSYSDLQSLAVTGRSFYELLEDSYFWCQKAYLDLNVSKTQFYRYLKMGGKLRYVELLTRKGYVDMESQRFLDIKRCFIRVIKGYYVNSLTEFQIQRMVDYYIRKVLDLPDPKYQELILIEARNVAAVKKNKDLVTRLIKKLQPSNPNPEWYPNNLECVACTGNLDFLNSLLQHNKEPLWNNILYGAVNGNEMSIVQLAILNGADDICTGMYLAAKLGFLEILTFLFEYVQEQSLINIDIDNILYGALQGGHLRILNYIFKQFSNAIVVMLTHQPRTVRWEHFVYYGAYHGHGDLIDIGIDGGATNWDEGLIISAKMNDINLVQFFHNKGATQINSALQEAALADYRSIVMYLLDCGGDPNIALLYSIMGGQWDLIEFLFTFESIRVDTYHIEKAIEQGYFDIIDVLMEHYHDSPQDLESCLKTAILNDKIEIVNYFLERGITANLNGIIKIDTISIKMLHYLAKNIEKPIPIDECFYEKVLMTENISFMETLINNNIISTMPLLMTAMKCNSYILTTHNEGLYGYVIRYFITREDVDLLTIIAKAKEYRDIDLIMWIRDYLNKK